jgi:hypothetical protein
MHFMVGELDPQTVDMLASLQDEGWRIGVEITADVYGYPQTNIVAIEPDGVRKVIANVATGAPEGAH